MADISNLTSKIAEDGKVAKDNILKEANIERDKILLKNENAAKAVEEKIIMKAEIESKSHKERIVSTAKLKARNEKLSAKQIVLNEVFNEAIDTLCNMEALQYKKYIKETILNLDISGEELLIVNEKVKSIIDSSFIEEVNSELNSKGIHGKIVLADETGTFKGGFILEKDGVQINNTFEAIVESLRDELEFQVSKELFN